MDSFEMLKEQCKTLQAENKQLLEMIEKVKYRSDFYLKNAKEYKEETDPINIETKQKLFEQHILDLRRSKKPVDKLLINFYFYTMQHMEIERLRKTLESYES